MKNPVKLLYSSLFAALLLISFKAISAEAQQKTITGELMDTWCYTSQIMGPSDFVIGTSHHVCAVWCAAGGIPVGLLDKDDGKIYMVLGVGDDKTSVANETLLNIQSHEITVEGDVFELDGLNYIMVKNIITDHGINKFTHETVGILPFEAQPE